MCADKLLVGIDGGGSKTLALLTTEDGTILGRATSVSSNYHTVGKEQAFAALRIAIAGSFADAGIEQRPIAALCMGLAGVDRPADRELFTAWANQHFPAVPLTICNDGDLVLAAGTPEGWGIAVICGTGSIILGRNRAGERIRSDGWGFLLSDFGSGFAIGLAAMQSVMAAYDGRGAATALTKLIVNHTEVATVPGLVAWVYRDRVPTTEIAALAHLVDEAAGQGDAVAISILNQAGEHLAQSVAAVARRLAFTEAIPVALAGGVITRGTQMADSFREAAAEAGLTLSPVTPVLEPAVGAVRIAQQSIVS